MKHIFHIFKPILLSGGRDISFEFKRLSGGKKSPKQQLKYLVEFHKHEDSNEVHEGRVELEGDVGGADVVGGGHHSLHEERQAQGEVETVL